MSLIAITAVVFMANLGDGGRQQIQPFKNETECRAYISQFSGGRCLKAEPIIGYKLTGYHLVVSIPSYASKTADVFPTLDACNAEVHKHTGRSHMVHCNPVVTFLPAK